MSNVIISSFVNFNNAMLYKGQKIEFPAAMQTSFFKIIEGLENPKSERDPQEKVWVDQLLEEVNQIPELREGFSDASLIKKHKKTIDKLSRILFPEVLTTNEIKAITTPFTFEPFMTSKRYDDIVEASGNTFEFAMKDVNEDMLYLYGCFSILGGYYGYQVVGGAPQMMEIYNKAQDLYRSYKVLFNVDLCEFIPTENAVDITREDYELLIQSLDNMELWKEKFPPDSWIMKGVMVVSLVDVTIDQSISAISSNLFNKSTESFAKIVANVRGLLNNSKIELGLMLIQNNQLVAADKHEEMCSLALGSKGSQSLTEGFSATTVDMLFKRKAPLVIPDVEVYHQNTQTEFSEKLQKSGFKSYIAIPLVYEDELMSFLEFGSSNPFDLHQGVLAVLDEVIPIFTMANRRFLTEEENLIEAIIQRECTTIHPSVKWRFEEEAHKFITQQDSEEEPVFKDIVFKDLYPLYGQMDIKGSSERRNKAVSKDLIKQIKGVERVLELAIKINPLPAFEELIFRLENFKSELEKDLAAGSEHRLLSFLDTDIYPVLLHLASTDRKLKKRVDTYFDMLDTDSRTVYEERKIYDQTVNKINQRLASYLDNKQIEAQKMFPHYFERYKTDGIEHNMYIGQSISSTEKFDPIYLKNLRLWQLATMCEMENEFRSMQNQFHTNIEIASLILVYNTPISVHFRMDEKQFDVEGAYNARYEIIKKRVDKAHIKGSKKRITQPGHIVIVYSQEQDAKEYRTYIEFLTSKGYLKDQIEDLALEDLQGVHGLRALRVPVAYEGTTNVDQLIKEIETASVG